ncbi:interleukin-1 receptor type 2-like [Protopterus annectens]|uniref:interleukin-1 receptor type 2-like n=1 Tax=Protopterus annectens TaxID=7888 RepID=UPI001CFA6BE2|nr:interleukin-1 receptor type 2-like [Protopterus annectens]
MSSGLIILILLCMKTSFAFRVKLMTSTEPCQEQIVHFRNHYVFHGEAAALRCPSFSHLNLEFSTATKLSMNLTWHWNGSSKIETTSRVLANEKSLYFFPVALTDSGRYNCILRNSSFCIEVSMSLIVYERNPRTGKDLAYEQTASLTATGKIVCPDLDEFASSQILDLKWKKDAVSLLCDGTKFNYIKGTTGLFIQNVCLADAGYYTCEMTVTRNNSHYKVSRVIHLITREQHRNTPVIIYPTMNPVAATLGSKLIIPCKAFIGFHNESIVQMWWMANENFIEDFVDDGRIEEGEPRVSYENGAYYIEVELIFEEFREHDAETDFKCIVRSDNGFNETTFFFTQEAPTFAWHIPLVAISGLMFLIVLGFSIYNCRRNINHGAYMTTKY